MGGSGRALLGLVFFAAVTASAFAAEVPIRAARWIKGADPVAVLTQQPAECLNLPADPKAAQSVEVGRAVFRSPTLLGGQAARQGVSCESCHRNGRGNPAFHFPGLSGDPGTADVTSALFSSHRDDAINNPKPIPDLAAPNLKVAKAEMGGFLHGLVVEEFNGVAPSPAVMQGLADYVRAIEPGACPAAPSEPVTMAGAMSDARRAVRAAMTALQAGDAATGLTLIEAARAALGQIDERYPGVEAIRAQLRYSSRELAIVEAEVRLRRPGAEDALTFWLARSGPLERMLQETERRSLYDKAALSAWLAK